MSVEIELLFDEFVARHARGEHPEASEYLEQAGVRRGELARLLDGFLAAAPVKPPSAETLAVFANLVRDELEIPPMLAVRVRMGVRRIDVVRHLAREFRIEASAEEKVARYYDQLETGRLDPRRVSPHVWHSLATVLGHGIRSLMIDPLEPPPEVVAAYDRRATLIVEPPAAMPRSVDQSRRDVVDELFLGGADADLSPDA